MAEVEEGVVTIPYKPRDLQRQIHDKLDETRFGAVVCHRRFGKTVLAINQLIKAALTCDKSRPRFGYIAPTFSQAKAVAWDYLKFYTSVVPGRVVNESELRITLPNESQIRLYGADNPDSLRGLYFDGAVLDEFGMMKGQTWSQVVRPALADRKGWALFIGTPNGRNYFFEICQQAKTAEGWFFQEFKASQTGVLPEGELKAARSQMTDDEYAQEFECSFEASVRGAVYAKELAQARADERIRAVPYDPLLPVHTAWDLGVGDSTAIWFAQQVGSELRIIDYYEESGEGLPHYAKVLDEKGYKYGEHWAPHDIQVRELGSGKSRIETAKMLGIDLVQFGVVAILNFMIALITPPYGLILFVLGSLTGVPIKEINREIWQFCVPLSVVLLLMIVFPDLTLWLPRLFGYVG